MTCTKMDTRAADRAAPRPAVLPALTHRGVATSSMSVRPVDATRIYQPKRELLEFKRAVMP
ncbi:hypothetical protein [Streptomyces sp. XY332]|uniref:hypothetical protein n=1 Tax=Streptomyces sp. XY332 TaxID=1415561 RepID=UPI000ACC1F82|nr:hypothetical protein [Streptomyces sp. XY332]